MNRKTIDLQQSQDVSKGPSKLDRVATRISDAARSLLPNKSRAEKTSSPASSTQGVTVEHHEDFLNPFASLGALNPALADPEIARLFQRVHSWDSQTRRTDPVLWHREVRLRCFRTFQYKKRGYDALSKGQVDHGNVLIHCGNCLADADLFEERLAGEDILVLTNSDKPLYKEMYGFEPEAVKKVRNIGILIDAINKSGTAALEKNILNHHLGTIRAAVQSLYDKLTDPELAEQGKRMYSEEFLSEILNLKDDIDAEFRWLEGKSRDMRKNAHEEEKELVRLGQEHRTYCMHSGSRRSSDVSTRGVPHRGYSNVANRKLALTAPWRQQRN